MSESMAETEYDPEACHWCTCEGCEGCAFTGADVCSCHAEESDCDE